MQKSIRPWKYKFIEETRFIEKGLFGKFLNDFLEFFVM